MKRWRAEIATYLGSGDRYHFARKTLDRRPPRVIHDHDCFEVFLIEQGTTRHWINGETETLAAGHIVFVRPRDTHAFQALGEESCIIVNVMVPVDIAEHLGTRYAQEFSGRFFWSDDALPDSYVLEGAQFERAINTGLDINTTRRSLVRIEAYLLQLMTRVIDHRLAVPEQAPAWLAAACRRARDPAVFRAGAAGFVDAAGRAHEHVCRQTRLHLGMSPTALVNEIRMQHAAMLLGSTDMTIAAVAADCGVENLSHFYALFRKHYGSTPRSYRQRHYRDPVQLVHRARDVGERRSGGPASP